MLIPEIFLPVEGVNSFTEIQYQFDFSGSIANVLILNNRSMVVKTLSNNEIIGSKGFFRWDGDQDDGTRASAGFYIVWFEVFQENGVVQTFRRRVIVASR